jgi:hypothetical protein
MTRCFPRFKLIADCLAAEAAAADHSLLLQILESLGEQIGVDAPQPVQEIRKTARAGDQFTDD